MVGVATKNRCRNCRQRKKKCDEKIPSCSQCISSGWPCPGYTTPWKFVDETDRLTKYYARRKYVYDAIDLDLEVEYRGSLSQDTEIQELDAMWCDISLPHRSRKDLNMMLFYSYVPRYLDPSPLGSRLVFCMGSKVKGTLVPLHLIGSFFDFMPARMGFNNALDDVVSCLCSIYSCRFPTPYGFQKDIYQSYIRSLSSLRGCIADPWTRMESETLCASILLQVCELIVNVDRGEWNQLARGTHLLLESRGVHRYRTAFDLAMLESQLGFIYSHSIRAKKPCFLSAQEWQSLLLQGPIYPFHTSQPQSLTLRTQRWNIIPELLSLLLQYSATDSTQMPHLNLSKLDLLALRAEKLFATITPWVCEDSDTLVPTTYPDIVSAVLECTACMALLTLTNVMSSLHRARSLSSNPQATTNPPSSTQDFQLWDDPAKFEYWRNRASVAFRFVKSESLIASKALRFGVKQFLDFGEKSSSREMLDSWF